jgi:hypothetical protein
MVRISRSARISSLRPGEGVGVGIGPGAIEWSMVMGRSSSIGKGSLIRSLKASEFFFLKGYRFLPSIGGGKVGKGSF